METSADRRAKNMLIRVGRCLYAAGLNVGTDGNFSCLLEDGTYLWSTVSGSSKGFLTDADLVKTDLDGNVVEGTGIPSSELKVHLCIYRHNRLARGVVHAHSVAATALACAGIGLTRPLLPSACMQLGKVHVTPYAMPGTQEVADNIVPYLEHNNAVLLGNHGPVTWGTNLWQAFTHMETLEQCAKTYLELLKLGTAQFLTPEQERELHAQGVRLGKFEQ